MPGEDYASTCAQLSRKLEQLRHEQAPAQWVADALGQLVQVHLDHDQPRRAGEALEQLAALRHPERPGLDATYSLCAAALASRSGEGERAVAFAERAVALSREHHFDELLPHALISLADCLPRPGREEEARWARIEAAERFEQTGQPSHAAGALLWLCDDLPPEEDPGALQRAVDLALRAEARSAATWALRSLGRWHLDRDQYLPARRALDRALALARGDDDLDATEVCFCLAELAWLEGAAFHHHEAIALATEAIAAAPTPFWKAHALEAREGALSRLHQHRAAREDLLEAARCLAGEDPGHARYCRQRATEHRIYAFLHHFPSWVYRPADLSSREAAARTFFQPFLFWGGGLALGLLALWTTSMFSAAGQVETLALQRMVKVLPVTVWLLLAVAALLHARDRIRQRREVAHTGLHEPPRPSDTSA